MRLRTEKATSMNTRNRRVSRLHLGGGSGGFGPVCGEQWSWTVDYNAGVKERWGEAGGEAWGEAWGEAPGALDISM